MPIIDSTLSKCTVIVTVCGSVESIASILDHARSGPLAFSRFEGFIAGATHLSKDKSKIIQYLQWENEDYHDRCLNAEIWKSSPSSLHFIKLMKEGKIEVDVAIYDVLTSYPT